MVDVTETIVVRQLGVSDYQETWQAMKDFTRNREVDTPDELWVLEHPPVFTLGTNGKSEHILSAGDIPIVNIDRGGQVTYHGPGQLIIYLLLNLHIRKLGIRKLVTIIEDTLIELLASHHITANSDPAAPGVYVEGKKIAALGLRVSKGCTSHGLSLNVDMDLSPFKRINPCGYQGLEVAQCKALGINLSLQEVAIQLTELLQLRLSEALEQDSD
ncbi:lipoyl(octanoyl) transferase LipB [Leucothrix arctica]|uniref:Octanoyltransferase n=1 Tax=Leucothrix arctica TaxID=1481894 RepID=A0A317CF23_9GAMM|nr:lipoyl(octanoyl) transferase LipB [Leucothrix arctica]PWQ96997.1 octanoyltransferase [Leucothrix arctica]